MPSGLEIDSIGPVDVAVIAFEGNRFNGEVAPALRDLQKDGTVRVLDLSFVRKGADGSVEIVELGDAEVDADFRQVVEAPFDLFSDEDLHRIGDELPALSSALVVAWENSWAARLGAAIRGSHGELRMFERIDRDTVAAAVAALDAA
ncbi:DUF6325 family protein [Streptomyces sp. KLOTTS4A1]|uniref:DUF6325 family protein n=1 Tax=Streptomyces sp. KLOTTS4A1 TaxID=3390996 RepID=UPI0039F53C79